MKKKSANNGVVIKPLGKTSGNIDPAKLRAVIRRLQADMPFAVNKKIGPIRVEDTASGSGAIRFAFGTPGTVAKPTAKAPARVAVAKAARPKAKRARAAG